MEMSFVGRYGAREYVQLSDLVENSLRLQESFLKNRDIVVKKDFHVAPSCLVEGHKIVHVLNPPAMRSPNNAYAGVWLLWGCSSASANL